MRKFLLFLGLFVSKVAFSQLSDNFTDGNFNLSPVWQGDASGYTINASKQLQTTLSSVSQNVNLYTSNYLATNAKWNFFVQMAFDPSSSNQARIYLIADQSDFNGSLNGYFVQIGESGSTDSYDLYKQTGTTITKIIDGPAKIRPLTDEVKARVQVTRDANGFWELKTDITGGTTYTSEGTITDKTYTSTAYFGVKSIYTSTRSNLFIYDDFAITELVPDVTPPVLNSVGAINGSQINANFNEAVNTTDAAIISHYSIMPGNILPSSVTINGTLVTLNLANQLNTGNYTLSVSTVKDLKGNSSTPQTKSFFYKKPYLAKFNDLVINEIFADPSPQIDLPSVEFIEIWNRSTEDIGLTGFRYSDQNTIYTFVNDSIKANQYLVLCAKTDTLEFKKYGKVIGLSPWPSLNNSSDQIKLTNQNGDLLAQVNYNDTWYKDAVKKLGGYTLELIDPLSACKPSQNYAASNDFSGGTPGRQNSIYLNNKTSSPLQITSVILKDSLTVTLTFNRGLDSLEATLTSHYLINNGVGVPIISNPIAPSFTSVALKYNLPLSRNQTYTATVTGVTDCGGTTLTNQTLSFVYPGLIAKNDILINEILFNPKSGGVDFVEVYNHSDKILDFKDLKIASLFATKDSVISIKEISITTLLFQPQTYWVITTNPDTVKSQYQTAHPNNFIKLTSLPSYNDDSGTAVILNKDNVKIDLLNYSKSMQFALLTDLNGVSLERSSFNLSTNAEGNFRSAAASVGYATPADKNSQYLENAIATEEISLVSQTFSPDNDGYEDVLRILYKFSKPNNAANVTVYNDQGRLIKKLVRNQTLATEGEWIWDGLDDASQKAKTGIYIIYAELFDLDGNVKKYKRTAIIASKFN